MRKMILVAASLLALSYTLPASAGSCDTSNMEQLRKDLTEEVRALAKENHEAIHEEVVKGLTEVVREEQRASTQSIIEELRASRGQ